MVGLSYPENRPVVHVKSMMLTLAPSPRSKYLSLLSVRFTMWEGSDSCLACT